MSSEASRPQMTGLVDFHNHVIPGVDDGAQDIEQARAALERLRDSGVTTLVATPHLDGSLTTRPDALAERLEEIDAGWRALKEMAEIEFPEMTLGRGVELMLNTPSPDLSDERVRLCGGEFLLMEFPYMTVPPQSVQAVSELRMKGWRPVIAHPERYVGLDAKLELPGEWRRCGGHLQVNAGSLVGRYGDEARRVAHELLARGWVDYIASDYHSRGRTAIRSARAQLGELGGEEQADLLMRVNPARLVAGEAPLPVAPLNVRRGLWSRIAKVFR